MATCRATPSVLALGWTLELALLLPKATMSGRVKETLMESGLGLAVARGQPSRSA